jgi:streptogramin lyase/subtilisin-like proprotein convertase family protein
VILTRRWPACSDRPVRLATPARAVLAGLVAAGLWAGAAGAATPTVREFSTGLTASAFPAGIAPGPDGALWVAENGGHGRIARISTSGAITEFSAGIADGSGPFGITAGPDGNLWFTEQSGAAIGKITVNGVVSEFAAPFSGSIGPTGIVAGPDGNLWYTNFDSDRIGKSTPGGTVTDAEISPDDNGPSGIAAGSDGNLWFTEFRIDAVARSTTASVITPFSAGNGPSGGSEWITAGPDGNLWFTERRADKIGRITPAGVISQYSAGLTPNSTLDGITAGPDGNIWFAAEEGRIGRITPDGAITEFSAGITAGSKPLGIATGADGNLWFTEQDGNRIGRINTALDPPRYTDPARIEVPRTGTTSGAGNPYPATIDVSGLQGKVTKVTVRLNGVHHAFASDVEAQLVGPGGQSSLLLHNATNRPGDVATPGDVLDGQVLTFAADGANAPRVLTSGIFKPVDGGFALNFPAPAPASPAANLSVFDGTDPNGAWKLFVADDEGSPGTTGVISGGWSLDIETTGPDPVQVPGPTITNTVTVPGPTVTAPPDTTKPTVGLAKLVAKPKLAAFRKGVEFTVTPSEPVTLDLTLSNATSGVVLAEAERSLTSTAATKLSLKPNARRLGKPKKAFKATLRIVATDKGGNRAKATRTITVQPDKAAKKKRKH